MPLWLTILRGVALLLALGVLIAAAYHLSLLGSWAQYYGGSGPAGFLIFDVKHPPSPNVGRKTTDSKRQSSHSSS
jgi:hypothetical protein